MERITTTERHAELREAVVEVIWSWWEKQPSSSGLSRISWQEAKDPQIKSDKTTYELADLVLPFIEAERVRVVEGLVATIKALDPTASDDWAALLKGHWRDMCQWIPEDVRESAWETFHNAISAATEDGQAAAVLAVVEAAREDTT